MLLAERIAVHVAAPQKPRPALVPALGEAVMAFLRHALEVGPVEEQGSVSSVRRDVIHHVRRRAWVLALVVRALAQRVAVKLLPPQSCPPLRLVELPPRPAR